MSISALDRLVFGCLCNVRGALKRTHTSCSAQGQMVHLLGDRAHHAGRLHGHSVVHSWRDHCTLVKQETRQGEGEMEGDCAYYFTSYFTDFARKRRHI